MGQLTQLLRHMCQTFNQKINIWLSPKVILLLLLIALMSIDFAKPTFKCPKHTLRCSLEDYCVQGYQICDGRRDCLWGDDEICEPCGYGFTLCKHSKMCIITNHICDGHDDCLYGTDELNCAQPDCPNGNWYCPQTKTCMGPQKICDGVDDCKGSEETVWDERDCDNSMKCRVGFFPCKKDRCLPFEWRCNGWKECQGGSDELKCGDDNICPQGFRKCSHSKRCLPVEWSCDGEEDCPDGSDEAHCELFTCIMGYTKCHDHKLCFAESDTCNGVKDCHDSSDEINCETWSCGSLFRKCQNKKQCVKVEEFCNGKHGACNDDSDEDPAFCNTITCPSGGHKCDDGRQCVWQGWMCDGHNHCRDGSDEKDCVPSHHDGRGHQKFVADKEVDKEGNFTLAAITKGDTIQPSAWMLPLVIGTCLLLIAC